MKAVTLTGWTLEKTDQTLGHQMVNLPSVGWLIPTKDELNEGGVVCELLELDGLKTKGVAVGVQGEQ